MLEYSPRTGEVFIRNFDQAMLERLAGPNVQVKDFTDIPIGFRKGYFVDVVGVAQSIPVIFNNPEQIYSGKIYPSYLITRDSIEPALNRWHSVGSLEYVAGVSGLTVINGVSGYSAIEIKAQAWPFDLFYTVSCYARYMHEAVPMLKTMLRCFGPYSNISLLDSLNETRVYSTFAESGVQDIGEYIDVSEQLKAFSVAVRVEAELDIKEPEIMDTVSSIINNVDILKL